MWCRRGRAGPEPTPRAAHRVQGEWMRLGGRQGPDRLLSLTGTARCRRSRPAGDRGLPGPPLPDPAGPGRLPVKSRHPAGGRPDGGLSPWGHSEGCAEAQQGGHFLSSGRRSGASRALPATPTPVHPSGPAGCRPEDQPQPGTERSPPPAFSPVSLLIRVVIYLPPRFCLHPHCFSSSTASALIHGRDGSWADPGVGGCGGQGWALA